MDTMDTQYTFPITIIAMIFIAIIIRSFFKSTNDATSNTTSTSKEVEEARADVAKARELLVELVNLLPDTIPTSSSSTTSSSSAFNSIELSTLLDERFSQFTESFSNKFNDKHNDVTNSKVAVVRVEAELQTQLSKYSNQKTELELNHKHAIAELQLELKSARKKLTEQKTTHENALQRLTTSNEQTINALQAENAATNDKAEASVEKYHTILAEKLNELQGKAMGENKDIQKECLDLNIQLVKLNSSHANYEKLTKEYEAAKKEHVQKMQATQKTSDTFEQERNVLQNEKNQLSKQLNEKTFLITTLDNEKKQAAASLTQCQNKRQDLENAVTALTTERNALSEEIETMQAENIQRNQRIKVEQEETERKAKKASMDAAAAAEIAATTRKKHEETAAKARLAEEELREQLAAARAMTSIEVEARETAAAASAASAASAVMMKPPSDAPPPTGVKALVGLRASGQSTSASTTTSTSTPNSTKIDPSVAADRKFKEDQTKYEEAAILSLTSAMKECNATELYQSLQNKDGNAGTKEVQGTVVKMTAAFAMQLMVDNATPCIDKLNQSIETANNTIRAEGFQFVKGGTEIHRSALAMQLELQQAIEQAVEQMSGDEAKEEARAAAAARGMPNVLQWTSQNRKLVKDLWNTNAPACMRYTHSELINMNHKQKYVFVPDKSEIYIPAKVISENENEIKVIKIDGTEASINLKSMKKGNRTVQPISDLSSLCVAPNNLINGDMNEAALLFNVSTRFEHEKWYSWMGPILLSVNPFQWTDGLYAKDVIQFYVDQRVRKMSGRDAPPHVFAVAERAFMALSKKDQHGKAPDLSIVVSGESGAGKTEAAKQNLLYLAAVSMANTGGKKQQGETKKNSGNGAGAPKTLRSTRSMLAMGYCPGVQTGVVDKIMCANPILEAFGNAKTTRNNNSSRFGKWLQVIYDDSLSILGSKNRTFLLEKSRVVHQSIGEHNFHVFYILLLGAPENIRNELQLGNNVVNFDQWNYLQWEGKAHNSDFYIEQYNEMKASIDSLKFTSIQMTEIFQMLAGILHLGNCKYEAIEENNSDGSQVTDGSKIWIVSAAKLLGVSEGELELWTTKDQTSVQKGGGIKSFTRKYLNVLDAVGARDSAAKAIYSRLFDWLVEKINNECLSKEAESRSCNFIGLLDIFGFERFTSNGFDQLCINLANEKLQQVFSKSTFDKELALYKNEGVQDLPNIEIPDNSNVLNHLTEVFKMLQDLVKTKHKDGNPSDKFFKQLTNKYPPQMGKKKKANGSVIHTTRGKGTQHGSFVVTHFAGEVEYSDWKNFYSRSLDILSPNLEDTLHNSTNSILIELFQPKKDTNKALGGRKKKKTLSVGKQFQSALTDLVNSIGRTDVHYIRCLKSNIQQDPMVFNKGYVERQMNQAGLPAAGRILVAGFPHKLTHYDFHNMHRDLVSWGRDVSEPIEFCQRFVASVAKESPIFEKCVVGKTMVMYGIEPAKELLKFVSVRRAIIALQAMFRGNKIRTAKFLGGQKNKVRRTSKVVHRRNFSRYDSQKELLF